MPEPRWHSVRCRECGGTAKLFTATGPKGSPCYFCGAKALVWWDGMDHAGDALGYLKHAIQTKPSPTHFLQSVCDGHLTPEGKAYFAKLHAHEKAMHTQRESDAWFRDALRGMGLG